MAAQVLKLTGVINCGDSPGVYVGHIKEISGIVAQGNTHDEVYEDLVKITGSMLEYKRDEALALLKEQTNQTDVVIKSTTRLVYEIAEA